MIGYLSGKIIEKKPPQLIIDVQGVGYEVEASMTTFYKLPEEGQAIQLFTHFVTREDAQLLYGFHDKRERALFRALIKVNGVGPKLALTILSSIDPDTFVHCVTQDDAATLVKLPGIGKKTAERLIVEMRDRLSDWHVDEASMAPEGKAANTEILVRKKATQDAISALVSLGYKPQEASRAISAFDEDDLSSEDLIRLALKQMAG